MRGASLAGALLVAVSFAAGAQHVYKWTDKEGRARLSDRPPANFDGPVAVIPIDTPERRRALREQLGAAVEAARANLEKARKALERGDDVREEEKQYVQERFDRDERRPARTPPPRANCIAAHADDGRAIWACARPIPAEGYYSRQEKLEAAVRKAEEDLAEAQRAYRRGVD